MADELTQFFDEVGIAAEPLSTKEAGALWAHWREVYAPDTRVQRAALKGMPWHAFSYGFSEHAKGGAAVAAYREVEEREYCVLLQDRLPAAYRCRSDVLPDAGSLGIDMYVVAVDCSWTMVFTHEGPEVSSMALGPYFARRDWQVK